MIRIEMLKKLNCCVAKFSIFLITAALIAGMAGCGEVTPPIRYNLTMVVAPGDSGTATDLTNASPYTAGTGVSIRAAANSGYHFVNWTAPAGTFANANATQTTFTMPAQNVIVTANFAIGIWDWYDLDAIRDNLDGSYVLMNDLDSTTAGYEELVSATANGGKGWEPIGTSVNRFTGSLDGQGYEIRYLSINRPDQDYVGLFGFLGGGGLVENLGMVNVAVAGRSYVGGLVGHGQGGTVSNSYSAGSVTGEDEWVGGLVGGNGCTVSNSYSTGNVTGDGQVGGLVGSNWGTVSNSYSTGSVTGGWHVGGLVGWQQPGTVSNSYSTGNVAGEWSVGGLVGENHYGTVSNSYYNYDEVLINDENIIAIGALVGEDFEQWLANDKFLDVNGRLAQEDGYYLINDVSDFKQLLAFGQNSSLKFRLKNDLDLATELNFYIPYLAGVFDGDGHKIANFSFSFDFIPQVGLFGYLASGGAVTGVGAEDANITGEGYVGGLVGENAGTVNNSYSSGSVTGARNVGGLVGCACLGSIASNSHYNYDEVLINGKNIITIGALFGEDFEQWLANDRFLDVNEKLTQENGYYVIDDVSDFKQLLAFGQDSSLKFRLTNDLDLGSDPNFYIPYLAGEFDGNGHKVSNLGLNCDFVAQVGLFGYLASGGKVSEVGAGNVNITGHRDVGGLVGWNEGTVSDSYSSGSVTSVNHVGGLVGWNEGTVSNSYSTGSVTGNGAAGGLMGWNRGSVSNSYSSGSVIGGWVGGLVGWNEGTVSTSFWDMQASGQATSAGGTGKTTAEMQDIATFSGAAWNIIAVANTSIRNSSYIWNIVNGVTYPFLSWQP